eukprot:CAMPEP_0182445032 /NCGR_PEP_ID=MMETSP1172-20130603/3299_1 /TAXON_ID=708627 /ORGANISM="Timspurckia oligopyrenoides, Strain CCMP3278" /LENGTH=621 /DNA_ID=CAMNT_0024640727 /DNA_START=28 /DNA_END=1893 /DNA_ORIENTATION=-
MSLINVLLVLLIVHIAPILCADSNWHYEIINQSSLTAPKAIGISTNPLSTDYLQSYVFDITSMTPSSSARFHLDVELPSRHSNTYTLFIEVSHNHPLTFSQPQHLYSWPVLLFGDRNSAMSYNPPKAGNPSEFLDVIAFDQYADMSRRKYSFVSYTLPESSASEDGVGMYSVEVLYSSPERELDYSGEIDARIRISVESLNSSTSELCPVGPSLIELDAQSLGWTNSDAIQQDALPAVCSGRGSCRGHVVLDVSDTVNYQCECENGSYGYACEAVPEDLSYAVWRFGRLIGDEARAQLSAEQVQYYRYRVGLEGLYTGHAEVLWSTELKERNYVVFVAKRIGEDGGMFSAEVGEEYRGGGELLPSLYDTQFMDLKSVVNKERFHGVVRNGLQDGDELLVMVARCHDGASERALGEDREVEVRGIVVFQCGSDSGVACPTESDTETKQLMFDILLPILSIVVGAFLVWLCVGQLYRVRRDRIEQELNKKRNEPLSAQDIEREYPEFVVEVEDKECAICLQRCASGQIMRKLRCEHEFHAECVDSWITNHDSCPTCRSFVRNLDEQNEEITWKHIFKWRFWFPKKSEEQVGGREHEEHDTRTLGDSVFSQRAEDDWDNRSRWP